MKFSILKGNLRPDKQSSQINEDDYSRSFQVNSNIHFSQRLEDQKADWLFCHLLHALTALFLYISQKGKHWKINFKE